MDAHGGSLSDVLVQERRHLRQRDPGRVEQLRVPPEAVHHPVVRRLLDAHPGRTEPANQVAVLVGEHVLGRDLDEHRFLDR